MDVHIYRQVTAEDIVLFARLLASDHLEDRKRARVELIRAGAQAVPVLLKLTHDPQSQTRWEAIHILGEIQDARAIPALVRALEDDHYEVRWSASEGLVNLGAKGLAELFRALRTRFGSIWLREGAHHVLRILKENGYLGEPASIVLKALDSIEPVVEVPWAAEKALEVLDERETHTTGP